MARARRGGILGNTTEAWHHAVIYSLTGQRQALRLLNGAYSELAVAAYPEATRDMLEASQVLAWGSSRVGLFGWAEVWAGGIRVPKTGSIPHRLGKTGLEEFLEPETSPEFIKFFGTLTTKSGVRSTRSGEVAGLHQLVEALERSVIGLRDPEMNDVGLSEARLLELIDFYARMIRMWMGLPQEQPVPEPDFSVDLPGEFQGFGPQVQ